jgi:hypothetical protein
LEHCVDGGGGRRILDQSRRLPKFGGRVVLRGQRLRIPRPDRGYREGLGHRRQGIRPVSTRPRQVRTERCGSAAGPTTHAVVFSDRHPARSATAMRQDQTNFSKIS